ncbi:MAG TPA: CsbD family protein [Polyangiaceae bacterium]|nr:CsbD family protein [Polyangiaceae bacterium]
MSDIHEGRWLQWKGRAKRAWGVFTGDERVEAEGNAEVVTGAVQESLGVAKREASRGVARGADAIARFAKKAARVIER